MLRVILLFLSYNLYVAVSCREGAVWERELFRGAAAVICRLIWKGPRRQLSEEGGNLPSFADEACPSARKVSMTASDENCERPRPPLPTKKADRSFSLSCPI